MPTKLEELHERFGLAQDKISKALGYKETILLASPEGPDADSCSSMFAFRELLIWEAQSLGTMPRCIMFAPERPKPNTLFKRFAPLGDPLQEIQTALPKDPPGLVVAFDYGNYWRLHLEALGTTPSYIGFDHHTTDDISSQGPSDFPAKGVEVKVPGPSTTALLSRFFKYAYFPMTPAIADCLLVGLIADTGRFSNTLTSQEAFEVAAELVGAGADYQAAIECMRLDISLDAFHSQMEARKQIRISPKIGLAFLSFSQNDLKRWQVDIPDILPLFGTMQSIRDIKLAAAYFERGDRSWYCSLRSKKGASAKKIAEKFGGGGHDRAAGFVSSRSPEEIFEDLTDALFTGTQP